ncbi:tRNA 5-methylaminomethyl-2-thiouridylate-methyltransferase [Laetiporus sulphureus 93-53]|uniref:tRNA-5-taurinomethyluridine 2-sulfurtransferase n=1 Tax=Laetiporus sulphureus 93-53 TaxID=1314785 RepID=A0A165FXW7_9APHY|nr:tRNA 5-methylaminomethyl-2-thiouridylate-methyltransferase [Laetiporus sulphureus 93-53]KZT09561.1 tRNA 5-methylaminomethyl-2-thiouridylate-methyltransferase [Laetiporus sulphureus 93-53]
MSGGVDSSVVAKLLSEKDYDLSAVYMRNWDTRDESGTDGGCEWKKDWTYVQKVCKILDIRCEMIDLSRQYWNDVFEPALQMWENGETPNPDVWCNKEVKFGALLDRMASRNSWIATGHYADKSWSPTPRLLSYMISGKMATARPQLLRAKDRTKDQTYYLSAIPEPSLARAIFPLAPYTKMEVRALAKKWGLPTAEREESMGICFIGEKRRFENFVSQYIPPKPGPMIELISGKTVGTHQGLWSYTIGQGARLKGMHQKMFVAKKDIHQNAVYIVPGPDHPALYCKGIVAKDWRWIWQNDPPPGIDTEHGFHGRIQIRHCMLDVPCIVRREKDESTMHITFEVPEKGVASGQVAAVWNRDWCLGCGIISQTF